MRSILLGVAICAGALAACSPSGPPLRVSAVDLYAAYLRNAAAADQQYGGHPLIVDGTSGGIDGEGSGYILTLVPGVRAHLSAGTSGANLFQEVAVQCGSARFADAALDLSDCKIISTSSANHGTEASATSSEGGSPAAITDAVPDQLSAAFAAATGHQTAFDVADEGGTTHVQPIRMIDLPFAVALLTERRMADGCHACQGYIGIFYLSRQGSSFQVLRSWPKAIEGDGWGAPPPIWYLTDKFTAYPAVYTEGGYMYQGESGKNATLTELQPSGPVTSETIDLGSSNDGAFEELHKFNCNYTGKIANIERDLSFDVDITGSVHGTDHYVKRNGKFTGVSEANRAPTCT